MQDFKITIRDFNIALDKYRANKVEKAKGKQVTYSLENNEAVLSILEALRDMYRLQIHDNLAKDYKDSAEKEIREHIKRIILDIIPLCELKIRQLNAELVRLDRKPMKEQKTDTFLQERKEVDNTLKSYAILYRNFCALASFRSYKHFCMYMQPVFGFSLWRDTEEAESGYFFYANKMVLDNEVNFMERQLPTGYGKTIGNAFHIAFIFGNDIDDDVLYVCGNDKFTEDVVNNVLKLMKSQEFGEIFPYFAKFNGVQDEMFSFCSVKALKFAINGSKKSTNLRVVTKLSDVNGVRAKWLFLDDITQRKDMSSLTMHEKDIHAFTHEWFERNYSRNLFKIIASGTTYSIFDILSHLKNVFNYENAKVSPINKYTKITYANFICKDKLAVFVCVPLLDPETDESTYPEKISTENARKKRETNYEEYQAMDNQTPLPPSNNPFYYKNLREYEIIPPIGECGRTEKCIASLDPKRSGKDFLAMPICCKTDNGYYLKDFLYDQRPMKDLYGDIVSKIIQHQITNLYIERNTDEGIASYLNDLLLQKGYTACKIEDVYSSIQKDRRISEAESDIKAQIIFPKFGMFARSSQMGKALEYIYTYTYIGKNEHDDSIDSLALFAKRFISCGYRQYATFSTFRR